MKRITYFLILLLLFAPVEDGWAVTAVAPVAPVSPSDADDVDEFLPVQWRLRGHQPSGQEPMLGGLKSPPADFPIIRKSVSSECNPATAFLASFLYVFMSLQI